MDYLQYKNPLEVYTIRREIEIWNHSTASRSNICLLDFPTNGAELSDGCFYPSGNKRTLLPSSLPLIEYKVSHRHQFHIARQVTFVCDGWFRSNRFWTGQIRPTKNRQEKNWSTTRAFRSISYLSKKNFSRLQISLIFLMSFHKKRTLWATKQEGSPILLYVTQILVPRKLFLNNILKIFCWSCNIELYFGGLQARTTWTEASSSIRVLLWGLAGKGEGWLQLLFGGWERLHYNIDCVTVYNIVYDAILCS